MINLVLLGWLLAMPVHADIVSNLAGRWTFDGTGNDASGNGNHCTLQGGATYTTGQIGQALSLNGSTQYASCTTGASLALGQTYTIAAWVNLTSAASYPGFVVRTTAFAHDQAAYALYTEAGERELRLASGGDHSDSGTLVPLSTWTFIAVAHDASGATFQVGTTTAAGSTALPAPVNGATTLKIGTWINGGGHMPGAIDEVCIYSRKLTTTELTELRTSATGCSAAAVAPSRRRALQY